MERWYVLHTKTSAEKRVASALRQREVEAFLPIMPPDSKQRPTRREPLFPGYLFARFDLSAGNPAHWKWIPGLRYLVGYGDVAIPMPDDVIEAIGRKICALREAKVEAHSPFKPGDVVRIKDGPFADMLAVFNRGCGLSQRVQILLDALDRSYKLSIEANRLERVSEDQAKAFKAKHKRPRRTRGRGRYIKR